VGILLITATGMEKLASLGRTATAADRVRTFHDPATGRIALRWEATGPFKLRQAATNRQDLAIRTESRSDCRPTGVRAQEVPESGAARPWPWAAAPWRWGWRTRAPT
jgi:hypothetical protein